MGLLTLYCGLLIPWLGGTLWLVFAESRFNHYLAPNRFRQAGYGFFLGYAVLFVTIMIGEQVYDTTSWAGTMLALLVFTAIGGFLAWRHHQPGNAPSQTDSSPQLKVVAAIMIVLMVIHILFITVEIFTQPVYPWDAWLAWIYRAKAWFMSGGITDIVNGNDWLIAKSANTYTINAFSYPMFPSVIPYWAALSLGRWSETLVNLPVLFAGSAIGMALYGQCREHGLSIAVSLISCYLLYSIPLFGTHLALAGYADIWMTGFTGLGFVALIRGASEPAEPAKSNFQLVLGFLMVMIGVWVKNEGAVWVLAALAMLILATCRPRVPILIMVFSVVAGLLAFALGLTHIDIPIIGQLGMVDGRLTIPFIANFALETHSVQQVYWDNFIEMGSWNLVWVMVATSLLLGFKSPNLLSGYRIRRAALSFTVIFLATQLFIFGFTDQGLWADTYTAINRLPLHFVPALLFAAIVIVQASLPQDSTREAVGKNGVLLQYPKLIIATILAIITVSIGAVMFLSKSLPAQPGETLSYPIADFKFAFGSGIPLTDKMRVDRFANGYALLSSGPVRIQADKQRVLSYMWQPPEMLQEAAFFWRRSTDQQNVLRTDITVTGNHQIDLFNEADWQGEITEFGFLVAGVNGEAVELGNVTLIPDSLNTRLQLSWRAWATFEEWSQQSINFLRGGGRHQIIALPMLITGWLLITLLLFWLSTRIGKTISARQFLATASLLFLLAWVLLDIRWSANNIRQMQLSLQTGWQADAEQRANNDLDGEIYQYIKRLKTEVLPDAPARILIIADENAFDYHLLRAKYHLLPHSVNVVGRLAKKLVPETLDYVIFFGQLNAINKIPGWKPFWKKSLIPVDHGELGVVYRVDVDRR